MKFTKSIVLAALLGTMTFSQVQSVDLSAMHKVKAEPAAAAPAATEVAETDDKKKKAVKPDPPKQ